MIQGMFDNGALPVLERVVQFTGERHRVLTHNIANLSTPHFKPRDLDPKDFQATLRRAIDERRQRPAPVHGPMRWRDSQEIAFHKDRIEASPRDSNEGVLFHDQNNRDLERTMQHLAENTLMHEAGIEMMKNQFEMLRHAIRTGR